MLYYVGGNPLLISLQNKSITGENVEKHIHVLFLAPYTHPTMYIHKQLSIRFFAKR